METFSSIPVERLPEQTWLLKIVFKLISETNWHVSGGGPEDLLPSLWSSPVGETANRWEA